MSAHPPASGLARVGAAALAAVALLLSAGCAGTAGAVGPVPAAAPLAADAPPDLAGHQFDAPHAKQVLVAGDTTEVALPTGRVRLTVNGPALVPEAQFAPRTVGELRHWTATFTITATALTGTVPLGPDSFTALDLKGASPVRIPRSAGDLTTTTLTAGRTVVGTWSAPIIEGHGEFLYAPAGLAPQVLWDYRSEA